MRRIYYVAMITVLMSLSLTGLSPAEEVTITTYYPAPYGAYTNLTVSGNFSAGGTMLDIDTATDDITMAVTSGDITMDVPSGSTVDLTGAGDLVMSGNGDIKMTGTGNLTVAGKIGVGNTSPAYQVDVTGDIRATNKVYAGNSSIGLSGVLAHSGHLNDLAEDILAPNCESGDVVVIDPLNDVQVIPSSKPYDASVAGVISIEPAFYIGKIEGGKPLALVGRVMCKVTTENGLIKRGDLLVTSSQPAHAMRADPKDVGYGMVLGKALQELTEGDGEILILVRPN